MTAQLKTTKLCRGYYRVSVKGSNRTVTIDHATKAEGFDFEGWIARADWSNNIYSDPCLTKAEALESARIFLAPYTQTEA